MRVLVNEEPRVLIFLPSFGGAKNEMILEAERSAVSLVQRMAQEGGFLSCRCDNPGGAPDGGDLVFSLEPWPLVGSWLLG